MATPRRGQQQQETQLQKNQEKLRAYDLATGADARTAAAQDRSELNRDKFNFEQQKSVFDQTFRERELEQRTSQAEQRAQTAKESSSIMKDLHEAQISAMQAKSEAQSLLDQRRQDHTTEIATNAAGLLKGMAGLDREAADYPAKVAQLKAQFSPGLNNPEVAKSVQYDLEQHDKAQTAKFLADPARLNEAIARGVSISGEVDSTNGKFIPGGTKDGQGVGGFVQSTYVGPTGRPETIVLPRANYDPIIAAYQAKQAAPVVAAPVPSPPPTGASAPAAAPVDGASSADDTIGNVGQLAGQAPTPGAVAPSAAPPQVDIHDQARAALQAGAPKDAVNARLIQLGGDPSKL